MMSTSQVCQRSLAFLFWRMRRTHLFTLSSPMPMPAKECSVVPPMLHAAIPVEAVTKTLSGPY